MAQYKIKNIDGVTKELKTILESSVKSKAMLIDIGKFAVQRNQFYVRTGERLDSNNKPQPFQYTLTMFTASLRRAIFATDRSLVDEFFKGGFQSKAILTGQLINNISFKIRESSVFLTTPGVREVFDYKRLAKLARQKFGSKSNNAKILSWAAWQLQDKQAKDNDEVYDNLEKLGLDFLGLDKKGQRRVKKIVLDEFRRNIRKSFK